MRDLLTATSAFAGLPYSVVHALACDVTGSVGAEPVAKGHSGLNHDGCPLQICLSFARSGVRTRMLGDPAADQSDKKARFRYSLSVVDRLLPLARAQAIADTLDTSVTALVGSHDDFDPERYPDGGLWVGVGVGQPGIAVYLDARGGGDDPVPRLASWLEQICGEATADIDALLAAVSRGRIMSAGIEGAAPGYARAKVYWRLQEPVALDSLGIPLFADDAMLWAVGAIMQDFELPLDAIVLNAGLTAPGGKFVDAKVDICCCPRCVVLSTEAAHDLIARLTGHFDLPMPDVRDVLRSGDMAFIGIGVDRNAEPRLNIYLKPKYLS